MAEMIQEQETHDVVANVAKEVKALNYNIAALKDDAEKAVVDLRAYAEEQAKSVDTVADERLTKMATEAAEKNAAFEKALDGLQKRMEEVATAANRMQLPSNDNQGEAFKAAEAFMRRKMAVEGRLKADTVIRPEDVDIEGYGGFKNVFPIYLRRDDKVLSPEQYKALSVGTDPDGGYLVPTAMSDRILTKIYETSPVRQLATVETIGTDALELPVDEDEAASGWVGETESRPETGTPQVGVQRIPVHEMYAKPKATQKFLEDASINVENWLAGKVSDKFSREEATAFVTGDGVKKPRGITTYPTGTSRGQIEQVNSGHASQVQADGIIKLIYALKEFYASGASFLMKRTTVRDVMLLKDSNNQYLWRGGLEAGQRASLAGYPLSEAADMPAVAANALSIGFGNWRMGYTVVDRLGITTLRDPYSAKPFVEFYSRKRVGGDVTTFEAFKLQKIAA